MDKTKLIEISDHEFTKLASGSSVQIHSKGKAISFYSAPNPLYNIGVHTEFKDVIVPSIATIKGGIRKAIVINGRSIINELDIITTSDNFKLIVGDKAQIGKLNVRSNSGMVNIAIKEEANVSKIEVRSLNIRSLTLEESAKVDYIDIYESHQFFELSFGGESRVEKISIERKSVIDSLVFKDRAFVNTLITLDEVKVNLIYTVDHSAVESIYFQDNSQIGEAEFIENSECAKIRFSKSTRVDFVSVAEGARVQEFEFYGGTIRETFSVSEMKLQKLVITGNGTNFPSKIHFRSLRISQLIFRDFNITSSIQFTDIHRFHELVKTTFVEFTRSSFHKLELIGCQFEKFDFVVFNSSDLTNAFIAKTNFPDDVRIAKIKVGKPKEFVYKVDKDQGKQFFEQIKTVHQKHGNRTEALKYQAKELSAYFELLTWKESFWDKFTLCFSKWSNKFGTSWFQGFRFFAGTTILFYFLILLSTENVHLVFPWNMTSDDLGTFTANYFRFIDPTSGVFKKWDFIYEMENGDISLFVVILLFFSKIFIVTMIYQIVQAFRKFGK
ncbi:hypothetical protein KFE98_15095 [bacterium SCSIO 12741]|nr:hypothetical protein KFE98_15095 [bacterium SCSIO 12741]